MIIICVDMLKMYPSYWPLVGEILYGDDIILVVFFDRLRIINDMQLIIFKILFKNQPDYKYVKQN